MTTVGVVGVGAMGGAMARNLLRAGMRVRVCDLDRDRVGALVAEGAVATSTPREAVAGADFSLTMLPTGRDVLSALTGEYGIAAALDPGAIHIDCSTVAPRESLEAWRVLEARGLRMIDAPVGGQSTHAADGTLLFMAGGDAADIERARVPFGAMGREVVHCGTHGMGATMKVVNNYMGAVIGVLTAETLTLAEAAGLQLDLALGVLRQTVAGKGVLDIWPRTVLAGDVTPGFMLDLSHKDLGLGLDLASEHRVPAATGAAARQLQSVARALGHGRDDASVVYQVLRSLRDGEPG